jgi:dTDP-4-amino-4,6-dideoxygalactose transaminase
LTRIWLSPPDVGTTERDLLLAALDSGWVAPAGPDIDAFEAELAAATAMEHAVALSSGTAALHLALLELGVGPGDDVLVSTFTFAASVNPIVYVGARPVLLDSDVASWNLSPDLLADELAAPRDGKRPKAAVVVDLYGQCADYGRIGPLLAEHGIPLIEDAAESLGATCGDAPAGSLGEMAVLSFNGNKIITTSGGGALLCRDPERAARARHLATQARDPAPHYEHTQIGFNYRLSNLLAAFGRGQLADLDRRVARRRAIYERYTAALADLPGIGFMPEALHGRSNRWLTCITIDQTAAGFDSATLREHLAAADIESRPTWKPMHLQPVFKDSPTRVDGTSQRLFETGLCLPSGTAMADADQDRVIERILELAT